MRNGAAIVNYLHAALQAAGERGPYVMVGHSLGGPYVMTFAQQFADEVAGVAFGPPIYLAQCHSRMSDLERVAKGLTTSHGTQPKLGDCACAMAVPAIRRRSPGTRRRRLERMRDSPPTRPFVDADVHVHPAIDETFREAGTLRSLGDRPPVVLTAAAPFKASWTPPRSKLTSEQGQQLQAVWFELHEDEASLSSDAQLRLDASAAPQNTFQRPMPRTTHVLGGCRRYPDAAWRPCLWKQLTHRTSQISWRGTRSPC